MAKQFCPKSGIDITQNPNSILQQLNMQVTEDQMDECALEIELEEREQIALQELDQNFTVNEYGLVQLIDAEQKMSDREMYEMYPDPLDFDESLEEDPYPHPDNY